MGVLRMWQAGQGASSLALCYGALHREWSKGNWAQSMTARQGVGGPPHLTSPAFSCVRLSDFKMDLM